MGDTLREQVNDVRIDGVLIDELWKTGLYDLALTYFQNNGGGSNDQAIAHLSENIGRKLSFFSEIKDFDVETFMKIINEILRCGMDLEDSLKRIIGIIITCGSFTHSKDQIWEILRENRKKALTL